METKPETTQEAEVDMSYVEMAQGVSHQEKPTMEQLDTKFAVAPHPEPKPENTQKANELLTSLSQVPKAEAAPTPMMSTEIKKEILATQENKKLTPDEFIDKYGSRDIKRDRRNGVSRANTAASVALDIYSHQADKVAKWASAGLIPALGFLGFAEAGIIASAGGVASFVAGAGAVGTGIAVGVPAIGASIVAYTGYKMFDTWRKKRAFKKNFGESAEEALGHWF